uniref:Putative conserved plasma membrane protein n=1 Tax=Tabanus bromius TaxID=304241 RepID=A0A0K8TQ26_TABBR
MSFFGYVFAPKLYKEYGIGPPQKLYTSEGLEKWGDQIIATLSMMWNIGYYTSPLIFTFLYRRGYLVAESITSLAKFTTGIGIIVIISLCMRGFGRSQSQSYVRFVKALDVCKALKNSEEGKRGLRIFDFDFKDWPVDFDVNELERKGRTTAVAKKVRSKPIWISSLPCEIAAYIAIHTFGIRMIYPGSLKILLNYLSPMLVQGRCKLIEEESGVRYKLKTVDGNEIDTLFVDNRSKATNGKTLVICSEGNAGFYEIGIMTTPLSLKYSVIGWNHPGFAGSTGKPYPAQDQNAIDCVMQFAIHKLNFLPENIILFGWSIGAYSSLWAGSQYPDVKGIVLDATFDDILYLALPRMPVSLEGVVKLAIREHVNLNNLELAMQFNGPILMIRRTEDEVMCTEDNILETNRGNFLLLNLLKHRYPNIFRPSQMNYGMKLLSKSLDVRAPGEQNNEQLCFSLLTSYVADNSKSFPLLIGEDYTEEQCTQLADYLIRKHSKDFKSTHCTPLPVEYFHTPWDIPSENDFVFT